MSDKTPDKKSIRFWSDEDKPREKLRALGIQYLSDAELLAIILGSGNRDKSAVGLAREMLAKHENNLGALDELTIDELMQFRGVGEAKAISVKAALELGRRAGLGQPTEKPVLDNSQVAYKILSRDLGKQPHEECWVLYLNRRNQLISKDRLSSGGVSATVVDVRMILKRAIEKLASGVILAHNHPSGQLKPSKSDINLTKKLKEACRVMDVKLLDHLIVTKSGYYSFSDEGAL